MDNKEKKSAGERLRNIRKNKGLSQKELASLLGYKHHASISNIESNKSPLEIEALKKIANVLTADLHWLITGEPAPSNQVIMDDFIKALRLLLDNIHSSTALIFRDIKKHQDTIDQYKTRQDIGEILTITEQTDLEICSRIIQSLNNQLNEKLEEQAWATGVLSKIVRKA